MRKDYIYTHPINLLVYKNIDNAEQKSKSSKKLNKKPNKFQVRHLTTIT